MSYLILHGVPLSQPFRSVIWPCLIKGISFEIAIAVPGQEDGSSHSTRRPEFLTKFPLGAIPSIEYCDEGGNKIYLSEAPAILAFLSSQYGWDDIYPSSSAIAIDNSMWRAKLDEYLHWHHSNLRSITKGYFRPYMFPHRALTSDIVNVHRKEAKHALKVIETIYLGENKTNLRSNGVDDGGNFLLGTSYPTAADFMAYEEIVQLELMGDNVRSVLLDSYPNIVRWMKKMKSLPYHQEVHIALQELGDPTTLDDPVPLQQRAMIGTKKCLKAMTASIGKTPKSKL